MPLPRSGDVVFIGRAANVQFAGDRSFPFHVIRVHDWQTYDGWKWLDGYQLNQRGEAVERRSVLVQLAGLRPAPQVPGRAGAHRWGVRARFRRPWPPRVREVRCISFRPAQAVW
ncbi:hypothetical protein QTQ03_19595 [Micromonospora sp. WMMA1363]|uniref:hypothetical protein n=1 Tax=Micromonospora sp. WMMA1363 TaxID=3053985 RepID=UPI00259D1AB1|nr:hypothetical protein [Micromonospora sp. WMMA1363]MDM4721687.1 hypothetical protein [Micromonospora sp. WMMA1363]